MESARREPTSPTPPTPRRSRRHRPRGRTIALLSALALGAAACSSVSASSTGDSVDDAKLIRVPDAYTPVVVGSLSAPTFPFLGTDGKYHVAYDLELTNASRVPTTIDKLDVVSAAAPKKVIASYSGTQFVDPTCAYGDCNRLRLLPSAPTDSNVIPPQESRVLMVDFAFDSLDRAPKAVLHHLYAQGATNPGSTTPAPIDYLAEPFDISAGTPRVIGPPVRGDHWIALNGCCLPGLPHRTSMASLNGKLINGQRFAIDWKRTNDKGFMYVGDKTKNESYVDYGEPIYAVADGTITSMLDGIDPGTPGTLPANDPVLGPKLTVENVDGNHIVQDIGGGAWAFYAHLKKGTLLVKPGDTVKKGQVIARLGNTGNSNASHMHFQLMNGPSVLGSDGLPYVLDRFSYDGQVPVDTLLAADDFLSGPWLDNALPRPQPRTQELPLALAIINFRNSPD
jgi:hypothetical protein